MEGLIIIFGFIWIAGIPLLVLNEIIEKWGKKTKRTNNDRFPLDKSSQ